MSAVFTVLVESESKERLAAALLATREALKVLRDEYDSVAYSQRADNVLANADATIASYGLPRTA